MPSTLTCPPSVARRAATRLAPRIDPNLPQLTDEALADAIRGAAGAPGSGLGKACARLLVKVLNEVWPKVVRARQQNERTAPIVAELFEDVTVVEGIPPFKRVHIMDLAVEEVLTTVG